MGWFGVAVHFSIDPIREGEVTLEALLKHKNHPENFGMIFAILGYKPFTSV